MKKSLILILLILNSCTSKRWQVYYHDEENKLVSAEGYMHKKHSHSLGIWKSYYPDGTIKSEEFWKAGKLHGIQKYFFPSGRIEAEKEFKKGKLRGSITRYYDLEGSPIRLKGMYGEAKVRNSEYNEAVGQPIIRWTAKTGTWHYYAQNQSVDSIVTYVSLAELYIDIDTVFDNKGRIAVIDSVVKERYVTKKSPH